MTKEALVETLWNIEISTVPSGDVAPSGWLNQVHKLEMYNLFETWHPAGSFQKKTRQNKMIQKEMTQNLRKFCNSDIWINET